MLKKKILTLILVQNNENTILRASDSVESFSDVILAVDGGSTDNTINILKKKRKVKILKKKFINCSNSLNYAMNFISKNFKNFIILRIDSDEEIIFSKKIKNKKKYLINNFLQNNKNLAIIRKVTFNNLTITKDLTSSTSRISNSSSRYICRPMDEKLIGEFKIIKGIIINDFANISLKKHFFKHLKYANFELLSYKKKIFNKKQKLYYQLPIFIRAILFGLYSMKFVNFNKNIFYNIIYQLIRTLFYRIYIDFLIFKKFIL